MKLDEAKGCKVKAIYRLDSSDHELNELVLTTVVGLEDHKMSQMNHYTKNKKKQE